MRILISLPLIISICYPKLIWLIGGGWKYKNVEPSDAYLYIIRAAAIIVLLLVWLVGTLIK